MDLGGVDALLSLPGKPRPAAPRAAPLCLSSHRPPPPGPVPRSRNPRWMSQKSLAVGAWPAYTPVGQRSRGNRTMMSTKEEPAWTGRAVFAFPSQHWSWPQRRRSRYR